MNAILLCAGFGTRLLPLTRSIPKALLPVNGRPVLDYLMDLLLEVPGLQTIHLVSNAQNVAQFYNWQEKWRVPLASRSIGFFLHNDGSLDEKTRLGSVGDLAFALKAITGEGPALITAGDTIYRFPLGPLVQQFTEGGENLVPAFLERSWQVRQRLPIIDIGEGDRVRHVYEQTENPPSEWVCPRLFFLQPKALAHVDVFMRSDGEGRDSLVQFLNELAQHEPVRAVRLPDARLWLDLNTKYMYEKANEVLAREPWMIDLEEQA